MKHFKRMLCVVFTLCMALAVAMFAACEPANPNENGTNPGGTTGGGTTETTKIDYTVTVTCDDTDVLAGITVKLLDGNGTDATEAKPLTDGKATFNLDPATYTVKLLGDALPGYDYTEPTLTKDAPSATVALTAKQSEEPDFTPFVGTWTDEDGHKLVVLEDGTLTYYENDEDMNATFLAIEDGILKFTYEEELRGTLFTYNYGAKVNGDKLDLLDLDSDNYVMTTLSKDGGQGGGDVGGDVTLPDGLAGTWNSVDAPIDITLTITADGSVMIVIGEGVSYGTVTSYSEEDGGALVVTTEEDDIYNFIFADGTLTLYMDDDEGGFIEIPFFMQAFTGVWSGESEEGSCTLIFNGKNVTIIAYEMGIPGVVLLFEDNTLTLGLEAPEIGGEDELYITLTYDPDAETLTVDDEQMFPPIAMHKVAENSTELPPLFDGNWTGSDANASYELVIDGDEIVFNIDYDGELVPTGNVIVVAYYNDTIILLVESEMGGSMALTLVSEEDGTLTATCSMFMDEEGEGIPVTFTKE